MNILIDKKGIGILVVLVVGAFCNASTLSFITVYIVDGLGKDPWSISVYSTVSSIFALVANWMIAGCVDKTGRISTYILPLICMFIVANIIVVIGEDYDWAIIAAAILFGMSSAAISTIYSAGRLYAEHAHLDVRTYNSLLRSMTSIAWMTAPALAFFVAAELGYKEVFWLAAFAGIVWLITWLVLLPGDLYWKEIIQRHEKKDDQSKFVSVSFILSAIMCLGFFIAHSLSSSALPLFLVEEAQMPLQYPGVYFSIKTFAEVVLIILMSWVIRRFDPRGILLVVSIVSTLTIQYMASISSLESLAIAAFLEGAYYGAFATVAIYFLQQSFPQKIARATSLYFMCLIVGDLFSGFVMGLIAQKYNFQFAIQVSSLASFTAFVAIVGLYWSERRRSYVVT